MSITSEEALLLVVDWLAKNAPGALEHLYQDVPPVEVLLGSPSAAEAKLAELRRLEGTED